MQKITEFAPAFDKRSDNPEKNYGIHCVQVWMVLKGDQGAVYFTFGTGMYLPETMQEYQKDGKLKPSIIGGKYFFWNNPIGYDVGYHSPKKMWDGQELSGSKDVKIKMKKTPPEGLKDFDVKITEKEPPICEWIGVPCYCDSSALEAEKYMDVLLREGSDKIWELLEQKYNTTFK